jgi:hypothetical protein
MELDAEEVVALDHGRKRIGVVSLAEHDLRGANLQVVGVNEVELGSLGQVRQEGARPPLGDARPPDVGHLVAHGVRDPESHHVRVDPAQPRGVALLAPLGHQLHSEADAQDGEAKNARRLVQRVAHAGRAEVLHRLAEVTHAGKDDLVGTPYDLGIRGDGRPGTERLELPSHGVEVAHPEVDDRDLLKHEASTKRSRGVRGITIPEQH